jgi:L-amino acid N-acyltransferase YncA
LSEEAGIWTIQSGVFPENAASLRLHGRAGFRVVGVREEVGCHHGRWRDTVLIERSSKVTGTVKPEIAGQAGGRRAIASGLRD